MENSGADELVDIAKCLLKRGKLLDVKRFFFSSATSANPSLWLIDIPATMRGKVPLSRNGGDRGTNFSDSIARPVSLVSADVPENCRLFRKGGLTHQLIPDPDCDKQIEGRDHIELIVNPGPE